MARTTAENILKESRNAELLSPCQIYDVWKGAARKASKLRNIWMRETRKKMSPAALAFSKYIKNKTPSFCELVEKYSYSIHGNDESERFSCVKEAQKIRIYQTIVQASGRTNVKINTMSKLIGYFGAVSLIVTLGFVFYGIGNSTTPFTYILSCLVTFKAGLAGAFIGSKLGASFGYYLRLRHIYIFILSLLGGICIGIVATVICGAIVSSISEHIYSRSNY